MPTGREFDSPPTGLQGTEPMPPPRYPERPLPARIGNYHIKRLLGAGGMGTVYEAVQEQPHRTVALKVMKRGVTSGSALRRFEYEAQILSRLRHPGIAQVFEAGTHEEDGERVPYFAMEYIPGARHLTQYAEEQKLGTRQRLELFARICEAVEHGHQRGIVHRDLKPGNILVDGSGQPKVIDFGVARATDSDLFVTTLQTDMGEMIGTLPYMSPEQCVGDPHDLDARSDVYSLGVVLYELLTGRLPYDLTKLAVLEAARRIREQPPTKPSSINRTLRGDVETIALKALEKNRHRRYPSAAGLGEDLRRYLRGEPIDARRDSTAYVAWTLFKSGVSKRPVISYLMAGIAAVAIAHYGAVPLMFRAWTWPARMFEGFSMHAMPIPKAVSGMENVRIIALRDGVDYDAMAVREGLEGVRASDWTSMRRSHGRLMEKLARAGARVVAWDVMFRTPSAFDDDFVKGVAALREAGAGVIIGVPNWRVDERGLPIRSDTEPGLNVKIGAAPGLRWGSVAIGVGREFLAAPLVVQRGMAPPVASFSLEAYAAMRFPNAEPLFRIDEAHDLVNIVYVEHHPAVPRAVRTVGGPDTITLPSLTDVLGTFPNIGIRADDLVGLNPILVPDGAAFDALTRGYDEAMAASDTTLREWYAGKMVLVGDLRGQGSDFHDIPDSRRAAGLHLQATTIGALFSGTSFRLPRAWESVAIMAVSALGGLVVVALGARRWVLAVVVLAMLTALSVGVAAILLRSTHVIVNPTIPIVAMLLGAAFAGAVNMIRSQVPAS